MYFFYIEDCIIQIVHRQAQFPEKWSKDMITTSRYLHWMFCHQSHMCKFPGSQMKDAHRLEKCTARHLWIRLSSAEVLESLILKLSVWPTEATSLLSFQPHHFQLPSDKPELSERQQHAQPIPRAIRHELETTLRWLALQNVAATPQFWTLRISYSNCILHELSWYHLWKDFLA